MNALDEWLTAVNAICLWSIVPSDFDGGKGRRFFPATVAGVSMYRIGAATAIVIRYAEPDGWDIYTPSESTSIAVTLRDAEARTGSFAPRVGALGLVFKVHGDELAAKDAALSAKLEAILDGDDE